MVITLQAILVFALSSFFLITDELLTRIGLKIGLKESNRFFNFLKEKKGEKVAHLSTTILGFAVLTLMLLVFQDSTLLSLFALGYAIPVVANAFTLWHQLALVKNASYS
jgi:hypothetical protein